MNSIPLNVYYSVGLMVVIGIIMYLTVDKRYKDKVITSRTRNIQGIEIVLLVAVITLVDFLQFVLPVLSNKFVLNGTEIVLIVPFLIIDKLITKKESFLG